MPFWSGLANPSFDLRAFALPKSPDALAFLPDGTLLVCVGMLLRVFDVDGSTLRDFAPAGEGEGEVWFPCGVAVDERNGELFCCDNKHHVHVFKLDRTFVRAWGQYGHDDGEFWAPRGLAIHHTGEGETLVFVADAGNNRIQVFKRDGTFVRKWGKQGSGAGEFNGPVGVAVTAAGQVVVSDYYNHRLQVRSLAFVVGLVF